MSSRRLLATLAALLLLLSPANLSLARAQPPLASPAKLVLAFYYAWYDGNTWGAPLSARPEPTYSSADGAAIRRHVDQAVGAGIDALVLAWLGPGNPTDSNLGSLLSVARGTPLRVSLFFETTSPFFGSQDDVISALRYAADKYSGDPTWLRIDGRPVFVFWQPRSVALKPGQAPLEAWRQIRSQVDPNHKAVFGLPRGTISPI